MQKDPYSESFYDIFSQNSQIVAQINGDVRLAIPWHSDFLTS